MAYPIKLMFTIRNKSNETVLTKTDTFDLIIKNPCIDPSKITILHQVDLPSSLFYTLYENYPTGIEIKSKSLL